jgi:hypothetical protein
MSRDEALQQVAAELEEQDQMLRKLYRNNAEHRTLLRELTAVVELNEEIKNKLEISIEAMKEELVKLHNGGTTANTTAALDRILRTGQKGYERHTPSGKRAKNLIPNCESMECYWSVPCPLEECRAAVGNWCVGVSDPLKMVHGLRKGSVHRSKKAGNHTCASGQGEGTRTPHTTEVSTVNEPTVTNLQWLG